MSTIRNTLLLYDGMSTTIKSTITSVNLLLGGFERMKNSAGDAFPEGKFAAARSQIQQAGAAFSQMSQEIEKAKKRQQSFNNELRSGQGPVDGLLGKIKGFVNAQAGWQAGKNLLSLADTMTTISARLDYINDGSQTTAQLQEKIYLAAERSRGSYIDMAQSVAKLELLAGNAFSSNDEAIAFVETMNKAFVDAGASAEEIKSSMYQLTQSMSSGVLQGDEFRTITEAAPLLRKAVDEYTKAYQKSSGKSLKEMVSEGMITAQVIKNALMAANGEITEQFEKMPVTFSQIWAVFQTKATKALDPVEKELSNLTKSNEFQSFIYRLAVELSRIAELATIALKIVISIGNFFAINWSWIAPIIWGIVAALAAYETVVLASAVATGIATLAKMISVPIYSLVKGATMAETAAQWGLNAALYACPLVWIIILIIILIAAFYAIIGAVNQFAGTSISATGAIAGAFMVAFAFIGNLLVAVVNFIIDAFVIVYNFFASFAEFFANLFNDPIGAILHLFADMADTILSILQAIASAIDAVFGSNLATAVGGWRSGLQGAVDDLVGKQKIQIERMDGSTTRADRFEYGDAWNTGYSAGSKLEKSMSVKDVLGGGKSPIQNSLDNIEGNTGKTADSAKNIQDSVEISEEDIKALRDLAEMKSIQNFVSLTPTVTVTTGDIKNDVDVNDIVSKIERALTIEIAASSAAVLGVS